MQYLACRKEGTFLLVGRSTDGTLHVSYSCSSMENLGLDLFRSLFRLYNLRETPNWPHNLEKCLLLGTVQLC